MAQITHAHVQAALLEQGEARIARGVTFRQQMRERAARGGNPLGHRRPGNGFYNADGEFESYLRLDIDNFDSGRGCGR